MRFLAISLLVALLATTSAAAHADCSEELRKVRFDEDRGVGLRTYLCRTDGNSSSAQVRIEYHRVSDMLASMIFNRMSSPMVEKAVGRADVVENEVYTAFMDLQNCFGTTSDDETLSFDVYGPNNEKSEYLRETVRPNTIRSLGFRYSASQRPFFPAVAEFNSVRAKTFPTGSSYFYRGVCRDYAGKCPVSQRKIILNVWRGLTLSDIENYSASARSFNALFRRLTRRPVESHEKVHEAIPPLLEMARYVGSAGLPEDFVILIGDNENDGDCSDESAVDGPSIGAWDFGYWPRKLIVEALVVENVSKEKTQIGALMGSWTSEPKLRAIQTPSTSTNRINFTRELAPNQKILIPTRILFGPDGRFYKEMASLRQTTANIQSLVGANSFTGQAKHAVPVLKTYAFGPELTINGLLIDQKSLSLQGRRSATWADLYKSSDELSCPFLMSWDSETNDWVDHGKILKAAYGSEREMSEARAFTGFRGRFRLEEREAEVAYIDKAELRITLSNGSVELLRPNDDKLTERDNSYLQLFAGQGVEIEFLLPDKVSSNEVVRSELALTGYYDRYSSLLASSLPNPDAKSDRNGLSSVARSALRAPACFPVRSSTLRLQE